jgi:microcystin-dependent protein
MSRVALPFSFSYETTAYVATSSGGSPTTAVTILQPAAGAAMTVTNRDTSAVQTIYAAETGGSTITTPVLDAGGNTPGWVGVEGSYTVAAAAIGSFTGASIGWEAVRGDGVGNVAVNVIGAAQIENGAVGVSALSSAVDQALPFPGFIAMTAGATAPSGWLLCNGAGYSTTGATAALFAEIGYAYGGSGGTFNVPDLRQKFPLGRAAAGTGSVLGGTGGAIDHTHQVSGHYHGLGSLVASTIGAHQHTFSDEISGVGYINVQNQAYTLAILPYSSSSPSPFIVWGSRSLPSSGLGYVSATDPAGSHSHTFGGVIGRTDSSVDGDITFDSGVNNPPFATVNYVIKT